MRFPRNIACWAVILSFGCSGDPPAAPPPEPIRVTVGSVVRAPEAGDFGVAISDAVAVRSAVELHLCEQAWYSPVSIAWAHVASSATREGTPVGEDLTRATGARITGEVSPPSGTYCKAYVIFSPADDDVLNMTSLGSEALIGSTLIIRGTRVKDGERTPFEFIYQEPIVVELTLNSMRLDDQKGHAQLLIEEGITQNFLKALREDDAQAIVAAFTESIRLYQPKNSQ